MGGSPGPAIRCCALSHLVNDRQPDLVPYGDNRVHIAHVEVDPNPQRIPAIVPDLGHVLRTIKPVVDLPRRQVDGLTVEVNADQLRRGVVPL